MLGLSFRWASRLALAAVLLVGAAGRSAAETPTRGGTLNVIVHPEPVLLMLGLNQQTGAQLVAGKIYQSLLRFDEKLRPMPSLAKSWTISRDGLTYTFKLQENVRWHDGKPLTSADVVFTTETFLMETHPRARGIFSRCEAITAPDPHTVVFKLKEPFGPFIMAFEVSTSPIVPRHLYEGTDFRNNPANQTPVGTGPFKFKEWRKGSYIHLVRNDDYWKPGKPYLDNIYFRVIPDSAARAFALESGQVQVTYFGDIENVEVAGLKGRPELAVTTKGWEFAAPLAWIEFNVRRPPMSDKRFRQAVWYAMDRDFIREKIWFGIGRPATGPVNSVTRFYEPDVKKYPYSPDKAKALLDEMGLKPDASGIRARVNLLPMPYTDAWVRTAEYLKQALGQVGIHVNLESTDPSGWLERNKNWDFDITQNLLYQFGDPALGVARAFVTSNIRQGIPFTNTAGYSNPQVDQFFERAAVALNDGDRQRYYSEAQKILVEDVPHAWFLELEYPTFYHKSVRNVVTSAIGAADSWDDVYIVK